MNEYIKLLNIYFDLKQKLESIIKYQKLRALH